ncbi:hypothetical protein SAMN06295974_3819 [Plantibacter flavus]|uniref:Uncharacterized protein n=1 Tax=Plantibacter flavus TaxID=150123 RepID=A0A3N2BLW7_9MICO|nr:hypothetical protein [Plantibacter flavus]ROR76034.1 hypothetical protein EDD42_3987 [Plantibacter flavus]SMG49096.1 hypothetical protein SAMN06295974_3819 [Plantibacter flavus]
MADHPDDEWSDNAGLSEDREPLSKNDPDAGSRSRVDSARPEATHAADCGCADFHRQRIWLTLDRAFPTDPHIWRALEEIFALSEQNPHPLDAHGRRAALSRAAQHLQQQLELTPVPSGPLDQLVEEFRRQLDDGI